MKFATRLLLATSALIAPVAAAQAATTISYTQSFGPQATDFTTQNYTLSGFNSALGTLTGVAITYSYTDQMMGTLKNLATNAQNFKFTESSDANFYFSGAYSGTLTNSVSQSQTYTQLASGASAYFGPDANGYTLTQTQTYVLSSFASFLSNNLTFNVETLTGQAFVGGGGNVQQNVTTQGQGYATVTYTYEASAVPEPATWGMMVIGFGAMGVALRSRKKVGVSFS